MNYCTHTVIRIVQSRTGRLGVIKYKYSKSSKSKYDIQSTEQNRKVHLSMVHSTIPSVMDDLDVCSITPRLAPQPYHYTALLEVLRSSQLVSQGWYKS